MRYIIGIDEGTTSARAVLFDTLSNKIVKISRASFKQYYPENDWVEHDAEEIWKIVKNALIEVTEGLTEKDIYGIGITNQRETVVAWSKKSGKSLCPAIVWQCRRTAAYCKKLKNSPLSPVIKEKTGLMPDSYFSASKIRWLLKNNEKVQIALKKGDLLVGTIESYLIYKLTDGKSHVTDVTNASRTQLFNIHSLSWDNELLELFNIPKQILPTIVSNAENVGMAKIGKLKIPICGIAGDQQSSLFGQGCHKPGNIKITYGTGAFLLVNTGNKPVYSEQLLTTVAYKIGNNVSYALEGSVYNCGTAIDWVCNDLKLVSTPQEMDKLAGELGNNQGVYMVPAFTGLGCPYWNMEANGIITGLTRATTSSHIARAVLEGIAYSVYEVVKVLEKESHSRPKHIHVDGGATKNNFLMQFQADMLGAEVNVMDSESTSLGAIYLAGLASGAYKNLEEIQNIVQVKNTFAPLTPKYEMKKNLEGWKNAIAQCLHTNKN